MISGHQIDLSDGRHVFYAQKDGEHFFRFKNSEGAETKFKLSDEATDALIDLLTGPKEVSRWILHLRENAGSWEHVVKGTVPRPPQGSVQS